MFRRFSIAAAAAFAALMATGLVGTAGGQLPASPGDSPTDRTVTVQGVGNGGTVAKSSGVSARHAPYRAALDAAMDDARAKGDAIAAKSGVRVTGLSQATEEGSAAVCGSPRTKRRCTMVAKVTVEYTVA